MKKKMKKVFWRGRDLNPGLRRDRPLSFVLSYRRFNVEMLKIDDFILSLPN